MGLADRTVRKMNSAFDGEDYGSEDGLLFCETEEDARERLSRSAGKVLLVSDETACSAFAAIASHPRALSVVFDGDCLPLFSMPDGVSCVLASGGSEVLHAARYFAEVRGISCTVYPALATLEGAYELKGTLQLGGERTQVPLAECSVVCDVQRLKATFARGYARLLLTRLANFETRALSAFGIGQGAEPLPPFPETGEEDILRENANARLRERFAPVGEGATLAKLLEACGKPVPEWQAYLQLTSLYAAFFEKGKPRRYFTPDYRARAERAGTDYNLAGVPTAEEYVFRAMALERVRARFAREALSFVKEREAHCEKLSAWEQVSLHGGDLTFLKRLPEYEPHGLSAVIRDFGLMEWEL